MAPIRRYLRITKYSVLEVRIYVDNPVDQQWLTNPRDDVLPRVFQAIRPFVLPKLREEYERERGKKSKRPKGVKDTVAEADFEVGIFLTDQSTRHSLMIKQKSFHENKGRIKSNSGKLTGWLETGSDGQPINVNLDEDPVIIREESDDEAGFQEANPARSTSKKDPVVIEDNISDDEGFQTQSSFHEPRPRLDEAIMEDGGDEDDKKKLGLNLAYDGFAIYGKVLCLMIKRKGGKRSGASSDPGGRKMLENWVSTQAAQEIAGLEDD